METTGACAVSSQQVADLQVEALNRTIRMLLEREPTFGYRVAPESDSAFEDKSQRVRYLIAVGYADQAKELAKALATEGLSRIGRELCPTTGHHYFAEEENE
jgi:hypothetical protein